MNINIKNGIVFRAAEIDTQDIDVEARTVKLTYASNYVADRPYGKEKLRISEATMRTERFKHRMPLLFNHDFGDIIGVVEETWFTPDERAHAKVRFATTPRGEEMFTLVKDKVLTNVSFSYKPHAVRKIADIDGTPAYEVTDIESLEISLAPVPVDPTVGIGRSEDNQADNAYMLELIKAADARAIEEQETLKRSVDKETVSEGASTDTKEIVEDTKKEVEPETQEPEVKTEQTETKEAEQEQVSKESDSTTTENNTSESASRAAEKQQISTPAIITTKKGNEKMKMELSQIVRAIANKTDSAQEILGRGHEFAQDAKLNMAGNMICTADIAVRATQQAGDASLGGNLIPETFREDMFVDEMYNNSILDALNVQRYVAQGPEAIPVPHRGNYPQFTSEMGVASNTAATFTLKKVEPFRLAVTFQYTGRQLRQGAVNIVDYHARNLPKMFAQVIQQNLMLGDGVDKPKGLTSRAIQALTPLTGSVLDITRDDLLAMKKKLAQKNYKPNGLALSSGSAVDLETIYTHGNTRTLNENGKVLGNILVADTNDMSDNLLIMGDFSKLHVVSFSALSVIVDQYSLAKQDITEVTYGIDVDTFCEDENAFVMLATA